MLKKAVFSNFKIVKCRSGHQISRTLATASTVDQSELDHFKKYSQEWWDDVRGPIKPLHSMNKLRVPLIRDGLINTNIVSQQYINSPTPLKDVSILDVGCGGGILVEALARIGGNITGLDADQDLIKMAKAHANFEKLNTVQYVSSTIEDHAQTNAEKYDAVVASEVIEHVTQKEEFLKACVQCLKPGGSVFVTTINQTWIADFTAILLGEYVFRAIPKGTHEYDKFLKPHHLQRMLEGENCKTVLLHGLLYNVINNEWCWSSFKEVNYAIHAVKLSPK